MKTAKPKAEYTTPPSGAAQVREAGAAVFVDFPRQSLARYATALGQSDPKIADIIARETQRQNTQIELIASENFVSQAVLETAGSVLTNKYAEGYPGRRYYGGCDIVDEAETLAINRACELFDCDYANVQPNSGSQANQAVYQALLQPQDTILGMSLAAGGHLTHGAAPNQSGKWFRAVQYGVREDNHLLDMDEVESLAKKHKPKLIIAGGSAYARVIDFAAFRSIADSVGAYLMVDMAHIAGLVATGAHPSPLPYAHVVTTTTHKTLRGPRGGLILAKGEELGKKLNAAIFPGIQGGPLMHIIAAKAVAFGEALQKDFASYIAQVCANAKTLSGALQQHGFAVVSGGTDNHLCLLDVRAKGLTGKQAEAQLEDVNITCNKNAIPFDPESPMVTSGLRLGSAAATSRGFTEKEFDTIARLIAEGLGAKPNAKSIRAEVAALCEAFPLY